MCISHLSPVIKIDERNMCWCWKSATWAKRKDNAGSKELPSFKLALLQNSIVFANMLSVTVRPKWPSHFTVHNESSDVLLFAATVLFSFSSLPEMSLNGWWNKTTKRPQTNYELPLSVRKPGRIIYKVYSTMERLKLQTSNISQQCGII